MIRRLSAAVRDLVAAYRPAPDPYRGQHLAGAMLRPIGSALDAARLRRYGAPVPVCAAGWLDRGAA